VNMGPVPSFTLGIRADLPSSGNTPFLDSDVEYLVIRRREQQFPIG
jgi:hypothetical protein